MAYKFNPLTGNLDDYGPILTGTGTVSAAADGTAALPGIAFTNDLNTGIYRPGADQLALSTNGTGRLFIDASGNVGIGTGTSVSRPLHVVGSAQVSNGTSDVTIWGNLNTVGALGTNSNLPLAMYTNGTEKLRITSAGLVGIGTTSPGWLLSIRQDSSSGAAGAYPVVQINNPNATGFAGLYLNDSTAQAGLETRRDTAHLGFYAGGSEKARLDSSGRLGIGTTSPQNALVVSNGGAAGIEISPTNFSGNPLIASYNRSGAAYTQLTLDGATNVFAISGTERARIDSSGRLLVGTNSTSSVNRLIVQSSSDAPTGAGTLFIARGDNAPLTTNALGALRFGGSTHVNSAEISAFRDGGTWTAGSSLPTGLTFSTTADGASSPTERMRITSGPQVLFGTTATGTSTSRGVEVSTDLSNETYIRIRHDSGATSGGWFAGFQYNSLTIGSITQSGTTGVAYNTSSDYRLKENVTAVTDGITRLRQLKPSRFNFIADPDKTVDGFIAHEVQTIVPEAITGEKDAVDDEGNPQYQGIDQSKLVPLLTAALQEAIAKIETLEARLDAANL